MKTDFSFGLEEFIMHNVNKLIKNIEDKEDSRPPDDDDLMCDVFGLMEEIDPKYKVCRFIEGETPRNMPVIRNTMDGYWVWLCDRSTETWQIDFCTCLCAMMATQKYDNVLNTYSSIDSLFASENEFRDHCTRLQESIFG